MTESSAQQVPPPKDLGYTRLFVCVGCRKKKRGMGPNPPMGWGWRDGCSYVCGECR